MAEATYQIRTLSQLPELSAGYINKDSLLQVSYLNDDSFFSKAYKYGSLSSDIWNQVSAKFESVSHITSEYAGGYVNIADLNWRMGTIFNGKSPFDQNDVSVTVPINFRRNPKITDSGIRTDSNEIATLGDVSSSINGNSFLGDSSGWTNPLTATQNGGGYAKEDLPTFCFYDIARTVNDPAITDP